MFRLVTIALLVSLGTGSAMAQVGQFSGVVSPFASAQAGTQFGAAPVQFMPAPPAGFAAPTPSFAAPLPNFGVQSAGSSPSRIVTTPHGRNVVVPGGAPGKDSFQDRAERCIQAGTAAGLHANAVGSFTLQCAN